MHVYVSVKELFSLTQNTAASVCCLF